MQRYCGPEFAPAEDRLIQNIQSHPTDSQIPDFDASRLLSYSDLHCMKTVLQLYISTQEGATCTAFIV